jgi:3-oxoadipate enol-lactonase
MPKIHINNIELHYEEHGIGAQPIVFIHGFLASSKMWYDFEYLSRLPDRYHAYAIDMRGHGQSHHVKQGCNLVQLADDVAQFIHHLQLGKCIYVGMSMGGAIGAQLALDHPDVLHALILMNPGLGSTATGGYRLMLPLLSLIAQKRWLLKRLMHSMITHSFSDEKLEALVNDAMLVSRETWMEYLHPGNRIRDLSLFNRVAVPTLVMIGGQDNVLPLDMQHRLAESILNAQKLVFKDEGHGMVGENPDAVLKAMLSFLEQLPGR